MNKLSFYFIVRHKSTKVPKNKYNDETSPKRFKQRTVAYISTKYSEQTNISNSTEIKVISNSPQRLPNYFGSTVQAEVYFKDNAKKKYLLKIVI